MVINKGEIVIYRATHYDTHCPNKNTQCAFQLVNQLNKWYALNLRTHQTNQYSLQYYNLEITVESKN